MITAGAESVENFVWQMRTRVTTASSTERQGVHKSSCMRKVTYSLFKICISTSIHTCNLNKPQNSESEMQNTTKPWTMTKSLFPPASYSHDRALQEPGVLPYSFLHHFQDHLYLNFIPILLSYAASASHQVPPATIIHQPFHRALFFTCCPHIP